MPTSDWIVIGGGIAGASCAYFLASDGHRVTLLERAGICSGTTSAGQNNIGVPLGAGEATAYFQAALGVYGALRADGFDLGYVRHGHLYVARNPEVADALRGALEQARLAGVTAHAIPHQEYRAVEPRLAQDTEAAVLMPDGAQVSPMQTVFELARAASALGARIETGAEVVGISIVGGRFRSVETTKGRFEADGVVIAAGVWSRRIGELAGLDVPVFPRKGQVLVTGPAAGWLSHGIIDYGFDVALMEGSASSSQGTTIGTVIQPLPSGNLLIGGSFEDAGFDRAVDRRVQSEIVRLALACVPDIGSLKIIRTYAGLRPSTPDGWPIVGACSEVGGLMLATGHGSGGIDGGPIAGHLVADLVAGRPPIIDARTVGPDRFGTLLYAGPAPGTSH
jgi:sarcosine oxidase subunit beta